MAKGDEVVPLGLARDLVVDDFGFLEVSVGGKEGSELLGGRVPTEDIDEKLAPGGVAVGGGAHNVEDVRVEEGSRLEDIESLVRREGLDDMKEEGFSAIDALATVRTCRIQDRKHL